MNFQNLDLWGVLKSSVLSESAKFAAQTRCMTEDLLRLKMIFLEVEKVEEEGVSFFFLAMRNGILDFLVDVKGGGEGEDEGEE